MSHEEQVAYAEKQLKELQEIRSRLQEELSGVRETAKKLEDKISSFNYIIAATSLEIDRLNGTGIWKYHNALKNL